MRYRDQWPELATCANRLDALEADSALERAKLISMVTRLESRAPRAERISGDSVLTFAAGGTGMAYAFFQAPTRFNVSADQSADRIPGARVVPVILARRRIVCAPDPS